ncbi:MAG: FkbM family methyltransferase [Saprospiraceae bacterium]|nr:FkbM family methyltransferase [Saprospiraceae bacterium]MCB9326297.1 FkbM family methyltransferase [Lewinellaceae bacterium]
MNAKRLVKSFVTGLRVKLLAANPAIVRWYYLKLWKPQPGSFVEFLDRFSRQNEGIFFIQVGSNDGIQHDPLYKFIKRDRWKGIMMEPQKTAFSKLSYAYPKGNVHLVNKAISDNNEPKKLYKIAFTDQRWASGISSFLRQHVEDRIADGHVDRQCKKYGIIPPENKEDYITYDEVECINFPTLLKEFAVKKVDLLHIDTEGFDYEVIKLFDFNLFKPRVVAFEHTHLSDADYRSCKQYLTELGYDLTFFDADTVAVQGGRWPERKA